MCDCLESYRQIRFSILGVFTFPFFVLHLHFNSLCHMGRCSNLLNTWKVCCRLVLGIWKPLAKHHFPCNRSHHSRESLPAGLPLLESDVLCNLLSKHPRGQQPCPAGAAAPVPDSGRGLVQDFSLNPEEVWSFWILWLGSFRSQRSL